MTKQNLFADIPGAFHEEIFETLLPSPGFRLERILSRGHATPAGEWLAQEKNEWVLLLRGRAGLRLETHADETELGPGDYLHIPAGMRHRVEWTAEGQPTVWLAIHY